MRLIIRPSKKQYPGQLWPQQKRLRICTRDGSVFYDYNPEIGNAISTEQYHGFERTIILSQSVTTRQIKRLYRQHKHLFQRILNESKQGVDINGNRVCELSDIGQNALNTLCAIFDGWENV